MNKKKSEKARKQRKDYERRRNIFNNNFTKEQKRAVRVGTLLHFKESKKNKEEMETV